MKSSPKVWWLLPAVCVLLGALAACALHLGIRADWLLSIKEGSLLAIVSALSGALLTALVGNYPTKVGIFVYSLITGLLTGMGAARMHSLLREWFLSETERQQWLPWKALVTNDQYLLYPLLLAIFSVTLGLYRRVNEIEDRYNLQQDASTLLKEAELFKLRQQLQPHFLYNSLNAISALVIIAPDKASEMIGRLSDFLRSSVKQGKTELVSLEEELEFLRNYLWIETVRFGDRLRITWSVAEEACLAAMPPFLLQPIMENAIRFGVYGKSGEVSIGINISLEAGILTIAIGNPYDTEMKPAGGTGFGLTGVRRRLFLMYARQDLLLTTEKEGYFITTLLIPQ